LIFTLAALVWATDMRLLHLFDHAVEGGRRVTAPVTQGAMAGAQAAKAGAQVVKQNAATLKERADFRRQEKTDAAPFAPDAPSSSSRLGKTPVTEERGNKKVSSSATPFKPNSTVLGAYACGSSREAQSSRRPAHHSHIARR
jgi:hypothetical protein